MAINLGYYIVGAAAATTAYQSREARKSAEEMARLEREQLAEISNRKEPVMPVADDDAVRRARRRSIAQSYRRRGRRSTILTGGESSEPLGAATV